MATRDEDTGLGLSNIFDKAGLEDDEEELEPLQRGARDKAQDRGRAKSADAAPPKKADHTAPGGHTKDYFGSITDIVDDVDSGPGPAVSSPPPAPEREHAPEREANPDLDGIPSGFFDAPPPTADASGAGEPTDDRVEMVDIPSGFFEAGQNSRSERGLELPADHARGQTVTEPMPPPTGNDAASRRAHPAPEAGIPVVAERPESKRPVRRTALGDRPGVVDPENDDDGDDDLIAFAEAAQAARARSKAESTDEDRPPPPATAQKRPTAQPGPARRRSSVKLEFEDEGLLGFDAESADFGEALPAGDSGLPEPNDEAAPESRPDADAGRKPSPPSAPPPLPARSAKERPPAPAKTKMPPGEASPATSGSGRYGAGAAGGGGERVPTRTRVVRPAVRVPGLDKKKDD